MSFSFAALKALRKKAHLSQQEIARLVGIDFHSYNLWERGKSIPTSHHLVKLADALSCSMDAFFQTEKIATDTEAKESKDKNLKSFNGFLKVLSEKELSISLKSLLKIINRS
jgi:transcriptional regulator with XRE-family HTH domain